MNDLDYLIEMAVNLDDDSLLAASEEGDDHVFSDAYNAKMQFLFNQPKSKPRRRTSPWRYAAASILIVVTLAGAATAGAFWAEITAFFQTIYSQYANFNLTPSPRPSFTVTDNVLNSWGEYWYPEYMVENYEFGDAVGRGELKQITFVADKGHLIQFDQMPGSATLGSDIEGTQIPGIFVSDFNAFAFEKNVGNAMLRTLVWSNGTTSFRIVGQVSLEELLKIAEHIVYVKNTGED